MDESPQPTRRSERVANRGPKPRSPTPSVSLITLSPSPPPREPRPPRRRQKAIKTPATKTPDGAAPKAPRYGDCITLSPSPVMSSSPQPIVPEELSTPASTQQRNRVRLLGPSKLYRPQTKRTLGDDAEMPVAKKARPSLQVTTPTPVGLQNQCVKSPDGEVIRTPTITARKKSRMPTSFGNRRGNAAPPEPESPTLLRCATDTSPIPAPVPEEQSPASPSPFCPPEEKTIVDQATKDSHIKEWLKGMKQAKTQLTPPTSVSSFSLGPTTPAQPTAQPSPTRTTPAQPTIQPSPARSVPVKRPKEVEVVSISSDSSSEPPSDLMSEHHSLHSYVSASKSTSKKQGSEYESARELLSTHEGAHIEEDKVGETAHVEEDNVGETTEANGSWSPSPDFNKEEEATPRRRVALDILASIF